MRIIECFKRVLRDVIYSERGSFIAAVTAIGTTISFGAATGATAATLGTLAVGTAVAGGVSAYGAYQQGQAQKNMMNYQAQAAAVQQQIVKQTATANITGVQEQASLQATQLARSQAVTKGAQEAAMGAQGIDGSGTAADIAKDTFTKQQMDQMTLQYNANVKSWNITNQANAQLWGLGAQQQQYTYGAQTSEEAGDISAVGSLLNTASQIGTEAYISAK